MSDPISICVLTHNSEYTLQKLLDQLLKLELEIIAVDSGSTDDTLSILRNAARTGDISIHHKPYICHSRQMNDAVCLARHDWVLCIDSDEIPTDAFIRQFQHTMQRFDFAKIGMAGRIQRRWIVLGRPVHAMYPCSSPDYVVRFFNRQQCRFNDAVVDDKVTGFEHDFVLGGYVQHHTFETPEKMQAKLDAYVSRLQQHSPQRKKSAVRGGVSALAAFIKWYLVKKAFLDGRVGMKTALYAAKYSYAKHAG